MHEIVRKFFDSRRGLMIYEYPSAIESAILALSFYQESAIGARIRSTLGRFSALHRQNLIPVGPLLAALLILSQVNPAWSFSPEEELTARAAILVDGSSGRVLYQREPDLRLPPASTTKVLTAIVTLESARNLGELLTVSKAATRVPASKLYLRPGQRISIEDLLYAVLLSSANDASNVLAEGIGGSVEEFAEMLTKKAQRIGANNTHYTNPHGLTAPEHYSTVRDLVTIFQYAMKNPRFRSIVQTKISSVNSSTVVRKKIVPRRISVRNHNRLLWNFSGAIGGKTGYTQAAQKCFVGAVQRNGATLFIAILGSRNLWGDTQRLLEYGFDNYETLKSANEPAGPASPFLAARPERSHPEIIDGDDPLPSSNGYVLQLGAFRERERAEILARQFAHRGLETFLEKFASAKGETTYRVRVGPYASRAEAQEIAKEVFQQSGQQAIIVPADAPREVEGQPS
jgi:D-alanyl-D-alanine carboxypeptidase (penicillin-binding protein 5/6)